MLKWDMSIKDKDTVKTQKKNQLQLFLLPKALNQIRSHDTNDKYDWQKSQPHFMQ